jgi:hypothetical protein
MTLKGATFERVNKEFFYFYPSSHHSITQSGALNYVPRNFFKKRFYLLGGFAVCHPP